MASAIEKVIEIAASNLFDNASVQTCLTAVTDLSNNLDTRVTAVIDGAPGALDTLNELAAALGDDANYAATVTSALATKYSAGSDASFNDLSANDVSGVNFFTTGGNFVGDLLGDVTANTVTAQNYAVGGTNFISATRQGNFRDLEVKDSGNNVTILVTGDGGDMSLEGALTVDTINEKTDASGVTIDSVILKDNTVTAHTVSATNFAVGGTNFVSASRQGNFRDLEVKDSGNNVTILVTGDGGDMSLEGTLTVDTINEKTSTSGVTIDGVLLKDGGVSLSGLSLSKTLQNLSGDLTSQVYNENFNDETVSGEHADREITYVTGRDGTGKALNTVGVTPVGLQWVQTLPAGRKSFSVWLKIPQVNNTTGTYNAIILDGRDSSDTGYFMVYYKNNNMYINTSDNAENKFPSKILIDGAVPTIGSWDASEGKQIGGTRYLQDDTWHHWYFELSATDTTPILTWFSGYAEESTADDTDWSQVKKLTASDAAADDRFGQNVDMCGNYVIVSAERDNVKQGAVYMFKKNYDPLTPNDPSANAWGQFKKITASDGASNDYFGGSLSIDGDYMTVAAIGSNSGVYIFEKDEGGSDNWGQLKKIDVNTPYVYIQGDYIVAGDNDDNSSTGKAYIFKKNYDPLTPNDPSANAWGQLKVLNGSDVTAGDNFGHDVAIDGDNILVSARTSEAVYVFNKDEGGSDNWGQVKKLTASDGSAGDSFDTVSIHGDIIAIGADLEDGAGSARGAVYVFSKDYDPLTPNDISSNAWGQVKKLTVSDIGDAGCLGRSVSIYEDYIAVGAQVHIDGSKGAVYIFKKDEGGTNNWGQVKKINADDGETSDVFGGTPQSTKILGTYVVAGAPYKDDNGNDSGSAYIFRNTTLGGTSFYNLEGLVDDYRIFNNSLNDVQITDLNNGGNGNVSEAIQADRTDINDISCAALTVGGVTIDTNGSVQLDLSTKEVKDLSDVSYNTVTSGQVLSWNTDGYFEPVTQTAGGLNVNSDISINAIDAQDASFNTLRTSGTMALGGHILPTSNAQYDLGSAEYKIRHLFLSDNSLWIGDDHKIDISGGKMKFKKRKNDKVPGAVTTAGGDQAGALAHAGVGSLTEMTLQKWYDYAVSLDGALDIQDLFGNNKPDEFETDRDLLNAVQLPTKSDAGAPATTPTAGTMVFNTNDNKLYIYNGSAWRAVDTIAV